MQAFVARHAPFFLLALILTSQFIMLAYQVTRRQHVPLIEVWAIDAFDPFERSIHGLSEVISGAWGSVGELSSAQGENARLKRELANARAQALQLSEDGAENQRLRSLLHLEQHIPYRAMAATVIAASPGANSAVFIDRGRTAEITRDLPVITPEGIVGKTIVVFRHTAEVLLLTDPSSGVGSMLEKSGIEGVVKGQGSGICYLDYITNDQPVAKGDLVVTSGLDQIYPRGLLVGRVVDVARGEIYRKIQVKPAAQLDGLENVLVILGASSSKNGKTGHD
jgi:rod shape-determining protein MreC